MMATQLRASAGSTILAAAIVWLASLGGPGNEAPVADAAMRGDRAAVVQLIEAGADVNEAHEDGMTALHWAVDLGDAEMADALLGAGADPDAGTRVGGFTPLHLASERAYDEIVEALLDVGADPNLKRDVAGTGALHFAAGAGSVASIEALVRAGAHLDAPEDEWGQTPLMFAAAKNRAAAVAALLRLGADPSISSHVLPLQVRAEQDRRSRDARQYVMDSLQAASTHPAQWTPDRSDVQRAVAASGAYDKVSDMEIERIDWHAVQLAGQQLRFPDLVGYQGGLTALLHAVREGHEESVTALLEGGADINQPSAGDLTPPLLMAMVNGHFDLGLHLLGEGADPTQTSDAGASPLYVVLNTQWAPKARYPQQQAYLQQEATYLEVMEALIDAGADVNARLNKHLWYMEYTFSRLGLDTWGATPFFRAAHALDVDAMRLLVAHGADPEIGTRKPAGKMQYFIDMPAPETESLPDHSGLPQIPAGGSGVSPIHAAAGFGGTGVARAGNSHRHVPNGWIPAMKYLVEELGADVNARDYLGYTPLHHAAGRGNDDLIRYLVGKGGDPLAISRSGQSTVDMANGPVSLGAAPFPETIALLEGMGAQKNFDCFYC